MATPESDAGVRKLYRHIAEVQQGLIPEASPVDFVRSDWKLDERGFPGWYGPDYSPNERERLEFLKPVSDGVPPVLPSVIDDGSPK